jgi:hypothetical protein
MKHTKNRTVQEEHLFSINRAAAALVQHQRTPGFLLLPLNPQKAADICRSDDITAFSSLRITKGSNSNQDRQS